MWPDGQVGETGATVPGYSAGARLTEHFSERLLSAVLMRSSSTFYCVHLV